MEYCLLDSGNQKKFERFGKVTLVRPCAAALWQPSLSKGEWAKADAEFSREDDMGWSARLPNRWDVEHEGVTFKLSPTEFGHLGVFPEHSLLWSWAREKVEQRKGASVLNVFAYSGGATMALAKGGANVCHVDASQGMVAWARENAALNGLKDHPIRWIVDDAMKFLTREVRRGRKYDGILFDPPSFGRGAKGEVFKIERDIGKLLQLGKQLLSDDPLFYACSTHTNGMSPIVMSHLLEELMGEGVEAGEMILEGDGRILPSGSYARWSQ